MSTGTPDSRPPDLSRLHDEGRRIVGEEESILEQVRARLEREAANGHQSIENLDEQMIELRDQISEAKEEDVASLVEQMAQVAAISSRRGKGRSLPVDPNSPYFGHLKLQDTKRGHTRDVLIGKRTLLDDGAGFAIVDWRNAPISRLYYRYEEQEEYEEEFDNRSLEGRVLLRRSLAVAGGRLRRVGTPQGTFVANRKAVWRDAEGGADATLGGGAGVAIRAPRGQLGVQEEGDDGRHDKRLQEITALIDKEQFGLITSPESGIVLIQGGAGSGKTTVALHRVAYLAFQDPKRFAPSRVLIMVFNEALVEYIKHVLPSLGVEGARVTTYRHWSAAILQRMRMQLPKGRTDVTPEPVSRFKKHPVLISMMEELVSVQRVELERELQDKFGSREGGQVVLSYFKELKRLPILVALERTLLWLRDRAGTKVPPRTRAAAESAFAANLEELSDVITDWIDLLGDEGGIRKAIDDSDADFRPSEVASIVNWCARKTSLLADWYDAELNRSDDEESEEEEDPDEADARPEVPDLDGEDDVIFLRLVQIKRGGLFAGKRRIEYEHIVIDEAQDLCPLEVRVLLESASEGKSVTIAGDRAQKMIFDNGFKDWPDLLADAGLPHVKIQPLKITYRSTAQIMKVARGVLGELDNPEEKLVARDGAPVSFYPFTEMGESVAFLAEALRSLILREPSASVALITRFPQQAVAYYEGLRLAEVTSLRLVDRQNFTFTPGIDVTDVRQVKGLEFDYVILLDPTRQNYPETVEARHLMHIAATRSAYQLWMVCSGEPSKLVPADLVDAGEVLD